ncbi:NAD(P)/FAD-dependent oxidoreductase [Streptomyces sp. NBC_00335]|uniref:FAD-dependent oxidoreductase n=1 Tax=unclassified Streptomyces TaxID=2593676 RepID=UPI00224D348A|nr:MULTISPECIES: NAD(P)/FAD-dependent oxidoreductase [unclassified Streptomyces]MCX5409772.1 NAD(P)/FAD-dependent oxidoreductase [Streptomyces sp. NBC_00086]
MYDVILIGARCAGSSTAMLLARSGARVLLLDRAAFPSDTVSTHFLHPAGAAHLDDWGLLEPLMSTGCPPIQEMSFHLADDVVVRSAPLPAGRVTSCVAPRRTVLDSLLVEAAGAAGAEFRPGCSFQSPVEHEGRIAGVTFTSGGRTSTARARLVIGADGKHSPFARAVGARTYRDLGVISCLFYGYWSGLADKGSQVFVRDGQAAVAFPTHHGQHCVVVGWSRSRFEEVKQDLDRHFRATVAELAPEIDAALTSGEQHGRIVGAGDLANFYRDSAGPGWGLVGDAGHTRDPASAHGIGDAFAQAELLADLVSRELGEDSRALDRAVSAYAAERDRRTTDAFETNAAFAAWEVPQPLLDVLRVAQHQPERAQRFMGVYAGRVSMSGFLAGAS